jgi:hypothetical protein
MGMRKIIRTVIIFWGIAAIFSLCYAIYSVGGYRLFGLGDGQASVTTWIDSNANGIQEIGEPPLANVCLWSGYNVISGVHVLVDPCEAEYHDATDDRGAWGEFLPGGKCEEYYVFVRTPDGYQATTDLGSNSCDAKFGFVPEDVLVKNGVRSVEEFVQRRIMLIWIERIIIGIIILSVGIAGTVWLQKEPQSKAV